MRYALLSMCWLTLAACSGEKGEGAPASSGAAAAPSGREKAEARAEPSSGGGDKPMEAKAPVRTIEAKAVTEPAEGAEPQSLEVVLELMPDDQVKGTLSMAGSALSVLGVKQGDQLRLWVNGDAGDTAKVRRGYLVGTLEGDAVKGAFAISGNGGESAVKGTWASVR
jgi:hypothetical protein